MVELDQFKSVLATYTEPLAEVRDSLDLANKEQRVEELEREMEAPDFWDNAEVSQKKMKELKGLKDDMEDVYKRQVYRWSSWVTTSLYSAMQRQSR